MVKCLPTMRETWVRSPGWEDPLKKEMATHSSTLAWKNPWMEEPSKLHTVHGVAKSWTQLSNFALPYLKPWHVLFYLMPNPSVQGGETKAPR